MSKALFLDRDGTLIFDKHYLADPAGVELIPGAAAGLRRARERGYRLFMLTNQSGIGRGYHTLDDVLRCNARMEELLGFGPAWANTADHGITARAEAPLFTEICIAPEAPDQPSRYRKPSPAFLLEMIAKYRLDPARCYMIGDREADVSAGLNAGVHAIAVCTGKFTAAEWQVRAPEFPDVRVFGSFGEFANTLD